MLCRQKPQFRCFFFCLCLQRNKQKTTKTKTQKKNIRKNIGNVDLESNRGLQIEFERVTDKLTAYQKIKAEQMKEHDEAGEMRKRRSDDENTHENKKKNYRSDFDRPRCDVTDFSELAHMREGFFIFFVIFCYFFVFNFFLFLVFIVICVCSCV